MDNSTETPASRALGASALALVLGCASISAFLPPMVTHTVASIPRTVLLAVAIAVGVLLHWVFLGVAARRLARSVPGWVGLALLFPVGGITALVLLGFFADESRSGPPAHAAGS